MAEKIVNFIVPILTGLAGAILTAIISFLRHRVPKILISEEIIPIVPKKITDKSNEIKISISNSNNKYDNIFYYTLEMKNISNKDYKKFNFGITLPDNCMFLYSDFDFKDRHHIVKFSPIISPVEVNKTIDVELCPFNRHDKYKIRAYITKIEDGQIEPKISSNLSIKFISDDNKLILKILKIVLEMQYPLVGIRRI
jgi:hypothetical protein